MVKGNHEYIVQKLIACGLAAGWISKHCREVQPVCMDGKDKPVCQIVFDSTHEMVDKFKNMPKWRKWVLNRLV